VARPADIASEIYKQIVDNEPDLLRQYEADFLDKAKPFDTYDLPADGEAQIYSDMLIPQSVKFMKGAKTQIALIQTKSLSQSDLITLLANTSMRGLIRVPHEDADAQNLLKDYCEFLDLRKARIQELIQERTSDEDTQEKIEDALMHLIANSGKGS
jgi:hypothetical protein